MRLSDEGLLAVIPSGGYAVREFSEKDVREKRHTVCREAEKLLGDDTAALQMVDPLT